MNQQDAAPPLLLLEGLFADTLLARALDTDGAAEVGPAAVTATRTALQRRLDPEHPLSLLRARAGLDDTATEVLALLVAFAADPRRGRLLAWLHDDPDRRVPTLETLSVLLDGDPGAALAVGPHSHLRRAGLLLDTPSAPCWADTAVALHPDVLWWWWSGGDVLTPLPAGTHRRALQAQGTYRQVLATGPDRTRRLAALEQHLEATAALVAQVPDSPERWQEVVRWATLHGAAVALECGPEVAEHSLEPTGRAGHLAWALCSAHALPVTCLPDGTWHEAPVESAAASSDEVAALLGDSWTSTARLTADQLHQITRLLPAVEDDPGRAVRRLAAGRIGRTAELISPTRTLADLVLPGPQQELVRHLIARAQHRDQVYDTWGFSAEPSRGVVAMFAGPSGTGKTLAAEVVAGELGLDLYRVDLSQVVDKYVGETGKNLSEVFAAASASPVVLFFDEADALLGRRSAVSDAHDRYANLEVAHLLQKLERHDGVVVLASNLPGNLDHAFLRRMHVVIDFPLPGPAERRRLWQSGLPSAALAADVDLLRLADRFELSGGSIRNAGQTAAFLAAAEGTSITQAVLEQAVRRELVQSGQIVRDIDFPPV